MQQCHLPCHLQKEVGEVQASALVGRWWLATLRQWVDGYPVLVGGYPAGSREGARLS